jgi:hypothetical protein
VVLLLVVDAVSSMHHGSVNPGAAVRAWAVNLVVGSAAGRRTVRESGISTIVVVENGGGTSVEPSTRR